MKRKYANVGMRSRDLSCGGAEQGYSRKNCCQHQRSGSSSLLLFSLSKFVGRGWYCFDKRRMLQRRFCFVEFTPGVLRTLRLSHWESWFLELWTNIERVTHALSDFLFTCVELANIVLPYRPFSTKNCINSACRWWQSKRKSKSQKLRSVGAKFLHLLLWHLKPQL